MERSERVLITGGTGFIGSHLARELLDRGHEVTVFDVRDSSAMLERLRIDGAIATVRGDVTDIDSIDHAVRDSGATRIAHLAAVLSDDVEQEARMASRVNVLGASNVLEVARRRDQVQRLVLASSETVYGPESAYAPPVSEDALLYPDSTYSSAKRHVECLAASYRDRHGISAIALRPTGVFGPFQESFTAYKDLFEQPPRGENTAVRGGGTRVSWLDVRDAATAFAAALLTPGDQLHHEVYNVRGEVATVSAVAAMVAEAYPDVEVSVTDDEDHDWPAQSISIDRITDDMGYEVTYAVGDLIQAFQ